MDVQIEEINFLTPRNRQISRMGIQEVGGGDCPLLPARTTIRRRDLFGVDRSRYALPTFIYLSFVFIFILVTFAISSWLYAALNNKIEMTERVSGAFPYSDCSEPTMGLKLIVHFYDDNETVTSNKDGITICPSGQKCHWMETNDL